MKYVSEKIQKRKEVIKMANDRDDISTAVFVVGVIAGVALGYLAVSGIIGYLLGGSVSGPLIAAGAALKSQGK